MVNSYIGVCRFCGQQAILEIDKEEWDMLHDVSGRRRTASCKKREKSCR